MPSHQVIHEKNGDAGRFVIHLDAQHLAEMTYQPLRPGIVAIDHTRVPPQFRGQDIAATLVAEGVRQLADAGIKIVPVCSYVVAQFRRHKEWQPFLAE